MLTAQSPLVIECNTNSTVSLFFPSKVVKIVPPSVNFKFEYDENTRIGTLKGRKGNSSNLTVVTDKGHIFSFALTFSENIKKFNYILSFEQAVGKLNSGPEERDGGAFESKPITQETQQINPTETTLQKDENDITPNEDIVDVNHDDTLMIPDTGIGSHISSMIDAPKSEEDLYDVDRQEYYRIFCENNYLQKTIFKRSFRQNKKIVLKLNNILVDRDEISFVLQIENNSKREFKVDGLSFFRKSVVGQLEKIIRPLYTFNLQDALDPDSVNEMVYVFKNFKISNKELIYIALAEEDSNNMVILPLDNKQVNFPSN